MLLSLELVGDMILSDDHCLQYYVDFLLTTWWSAHRIRINAQHYLKLHHQKKPWCNLLVNRNFFLKTMEVLCLLEMLRKVEDVEMLDEDEVGDEKVFHQHDLASSALVMDEAS